MTRYRRKRGEVEAVQFTEAVRSLGTVLAFGEGFVREALTSRGSPSVLMVTTLHGDVFVHHGEWIIKGGPGDFWPCKPDVFAASYEPASTGERGGARCKGCGGIMSPEPLCSDCASGENERAGADTWPRAPWAGPPADTRCPILAPHDCKWTNAEPPPPRSSGTTARVVPCTACDGSGDTFTGGDCVVCDGCGEVFARPAPVAGAVSGQGGET